MRLETPVIYFYPSKGFDTPFDVNVRFFGGWLTQYFPDAVASAPGISQTGFGSLKSLPTGSLTWKDVSFADSGEGPVTDAHVWTAPRRVNSATVQVKDEREKYLFYRGVAHVNAPLRVVRSGPELIITGSARKIRCFGWRTSGGMARLRFAFCARLTRRRRSSFGRPRHFSRKIIRQRQSAT